MLWFLPFSPPSFFLSCITPAQGDETGWFRQRDNDYVSWEGLQLAMGASPDVPYVSTPHAIVDEMVRLADVKASDVVYDLGCGDGRLVIAAVKKTGCRGVGIDIDPERIKESRANARAAGVEDRVRFVEQNFFASDIREATVMLIYLFPDVNIRLRGKFLSEMKPGSRLVSNAFDMGDWRPDNSAVIGGQRVYYWVIPANATGTWKWRSPDGRRTAFMLKMEQSYQAIRGTLTQEGQQSTLTDAKLTGDRITFRVEQDAGGGKQPGNLPGQSAETPSPARSCQQRGRGCRTTGGKRFATRRPCGRSNRDISIRIFSGTSRRQGKK